jgi:hypothetical protein
VFLLVKNVKNISRTSKYLITGILLKKIKKIKIFTVSPEDEERFNIQYAASQGRVEPRAAPPKHSGIAADP